jgi:CheY-like chemotaxis protein
MDYPNMVLLIDDDAEEHEILLAALRQCCKSVEVTYEKDAHAAIQRLSDENIPVPDMVFLDWRMPQASGKDILVKIANLHRYAGVPVIVFSGSAAPADRTEAEKLGAFYFMYKPSGLSELCQKLEHLFSLNWRQTPPSSSG